MNFGRCLKGIYLFRSTRLFLENFASPINGSIATAIRLDYRIFTAATMVIYLLHAVPRRRIADHPEGCRTPGHGVGKVSKGLDHRVTLQYI